MGGRILIADDVVTERIALRGSLAAARYDVATFDPASAHFGPAYRPRIQDPAAILIDHGFSGGALKLCTDLTENATREDLPVILYGCDGSAEQRLAAFRAGAAECLPARPEAPLLLALLRSLLRTRSGFRELANRRALLGPPGLAEEAAAFTGKSRLQLVQRARDRGWLSALAPHFRGDVQPVAPDAVFDGDRDAAPPDAYLISMSLDTPDNALRLVSELRARSASRHAVIALQCDGQLDGRAAIALDIGADAIFPGPLCPEEAALRLERMIERKRSADTLRREIEERLDEATRDPLTGLFNRRYARDYLARLSRDASPSGKPLAVMMLDLDNFKSVNDRYGHPVGDEVLIGLADRLREALRDMDFVARIGGEEFLVILKDVDDGLALRAATRLCGTVAGSPFLSRRADTAIALTVSIGFTLCAGTADPDSLIAEADRALYLSKRAGRNRVTAAPSRTAA